MVVASEDPQQAASLAPPGLKARIGGGSAIALVTAQKVSHSLAWLPLNPGVSGRRWWGDPWHPWGGEVEVRPGTHAVDAQSLLHLSYKGPLFVSGPERFVLPLWGHRWGHRPVECEALELGPAQDDQHQHQRKQRAPSFVGAGGDIGWSDDSI